jgi:hypothetical protein
MPQPLPTPLVGIQVSPIAFMDEGVETLLDTLQGRFGINTVMVGTVSWLGLKVGRSPAAPQDGWPDHGVPEPYALTGGGYLNHRAEYYRDTRMAGFRTRDAAFAGKDILDLVIPAARARDMRVVPELMEPVFRSPKTRTIPIDIAGFPELLEVDLLGRVGADPCTSHPEYRRWWHGIFEEHCREYDIDGMMWCNERHSPLDRMMQGEAPGCFCAQCRREATDRGIDVERVRLAFREVWAWFQDAHAGKPLVDGAFVEFLRVLLRNPEVLLWERFWLERSKDLDRELFGIVKWCDPKLSFGLNVWNRNHFNPIRKAQWSWAEQTAWCDWVKPITYQHQAGGVFVKEMEAFGATILRDIAMTDFVPAMYAILGLKEAPVESVVQQGMDPDSYVYGQCADAVRGVAGKADVYMGIGVDAPRSRPDQARCTPDIVRRSVLATFRAGGKGVVYSPNYTSMRLANLDGGALALKELGFRGGGG